MRQVIVYCSAIGYRRPLAPALLIRKPASATNFFRLVRVCTSGKVRELKRSLEFKKLDPQFQEERRPSFFFSTAERLKKLLDIFLMYYTLVLRDDLPAFPLLIALENTYSPSADTTVRPRYLNNLITFCNSAHLTESPSGYSLQLPVIAKRLAVRGFSNQHMNIEHCVDTVTPNHRSISVTLILHQLPSHFAPYSEISCCRPQL